MRVLAIGDIVGEGGREAAARLVYNLVEQQNIDLVVANGENSAHGKGITTKVAEELFSIGVDVITGGNHIFDNKEGHNLFDMEERILRPYNYPKGIIGSGVGVYKAADGTMVGVINLIGRVFVDAFDCPFLGLDDAIEKIKNKCDIILVDFHAEATSEKIALANYADGRVSALFGTHTHVQTADECIMPKGTGYITDLGMCGVYNSVLGMDTDIVVQRFLTKMPAKFALAEGNRQFNATIFDIDILTKKTVVVTRIFERNV